jgi:hypothetical protein
MFEQMRYSLKHDALTRERAKDWLLTRIHLCLLNMQHEYRPYTLNQREHEEQSIGTGKSENE